MNLKKGGINEKKKLEWKRKIIQIWDGEGRLYVDVESSREIWQEESNSVDVTRGGMRFRLELSR